MIDSKSTNSASAPTIVENVAPQSAASSPTLTPQPELPADELARRAAISKRLAGAFGEIVSVLMRSEAHRAQS